MEKDVLSLTQKHFKLDLEDSSFVNSHINTIKNQNQQLEIKIMDLLLEFKSQTRSNRLQELSYKSNKIIVFIDQMNKVIESILDVLQQHKIKIKLIFKKYKLLKIQNQNKGKQIQSMKSLIQKLKKQTNKQMKGIQQKYQNSADKINFQMETQTSNFEEHNSFLKNSSIHHSGISQNIKNTQNDKYLKQNKINILDLKKSLQQSKNHIFQKCKQKESVSKQYLQLQQKNTTNNNKQNNKKQFTVCLLEPIKLLNNNKQRYQILSIIKSFDYQNKYQPYIKQFDKITTNFSQQQPLQQKYIQLLALNQQKILEKQAQIKEIEIYYLSLMNRIKISKSKQIQNLQKIIDQKQRKLNIYKELINWRDLEIQQLKKTIHIQLTNNRQLQQSIKNSHNQFKKRNNMQTQIFFLVGQQPFKQNIDQSQSLFSGSSFIKLESTMKSQKQIAWRKNLQQNDQKVSQVSQKQDQCTKIIENINNLEVNTHRFK